MPTTFRPCNPKQGRLLPADLEEWLPEGHLAHHVDDIVDSLDLGALYAPYQGDGRRNSPFEPRMMLKVLVHAYATGVFPSRRIARRLEEDVAFRMLAADNFPSRGTICEFRRRHLAELERRGIDGQSRPGARGAPISASARRPSRRRGGWPGSSPRPKAGSATRGASGCPRRPTAGSRRRWGSGGSASGGWPRCAGSGTWCAWPSTSGG